MTSNGSEPIDVLVSGLGPAGAATAVRLAQAGLRVTAIDRARFPRDKVCSEYLSPEAVRHLSLLGVLDRVEPLGTPLHGARVVSPMGSEVTGIFSKAATAPFRPTGLSVPRLILDHALVDLAKASGVTVMEETSLVGLDQTGPRPVARVRQGATHRTLEPRLVVGADGLHSLTARLAGRRRTGWPARFGFVAHVEGVRDIGLTAEMHVGRGGYVGLNAIGGGVTNVAVVVSARRAQTAKGDPEQFWFDALTALAGVRGRVDRSRITRPVMVTGPFAAWSGAVVSDGLLLVGDAADFFDPFTGEGICAALRGAELAAPVIIAALQAEGPIRRAALAPYALARRRAFQGKWIVERMIGYAMEAPWLFDRAVNRLGRRDLGHTLIGVTGDFVPAGQVLRPSFLAAMMV